MFITFLSFFAIDSTRKLQASLFAASIKIWQSLILISLVGSITTSLHILLLNNFLAQLSPGPFAKLIEADSCSSKSTYGGLLYGAVSGVLAKSLRRI
jgi:hypothetical protein